jgi:hypothetical protein
MVFTCSFCEKETCYISKFCVDCRKIKNIGNVYGFKEILNVLNNVCIRNTQQRKNKEDIILKQKEINKEVEKKKEANDLEDYNKPVTRNKSKK